MTVGFALNVLHERSMSEVTELVRWNVFHMYTKRIRREISITPTAPIVAITNCIL